jgi:hypothetical protein
MAALSEQLISRWEQDKARAPIAETAVLTRMTREGIFPQTWSDEREKEAGLYPDIEDPHFSEKLSVKKEFYNARAEPFASGKEKGDACSLSAFEAFALSPVQRLVSRFMNPSTPYLGLLLYHGVGVGKTISAISIAENFLAERPTKRAYIVVPRSIAPGFKRTIFDADVLRPATVDDPGRYVYKGWYSAQATGTTYLKLVNANQMDEKEKIVFRIEALKRSRYSIKGYMAFKLGIDKLYKQKIPASMTNPDEIKLEKRKILKRIFDNGLIVIDEAHNLRQDPKSMTADEIAPDETPDIKSIEEGAEAKAIVPLLLEILLYTEGCRLVLMTATPMFNTAPEILFLLNLLILNDKKQLDLLKAELFDSKGMLKPESEEIIKNIATRYVSYMRGENPFTFPIRLHPTIEEDAAPYPTMTALRGGEEIDVPPEILEGIAALPIQRVRPLAGSICEKVSRFQMNVALAQGDEEEGEGPFEIGRRKNVLDAWAQIGNFTYPNEKFGKEGWEEYFREDKRVVEWKSETSIDAVFGEGALANHGPKIAKILETIRTSKGINFVYSRYVQPGALPFCIALERAGYTRVNATGEPVPLLRGSPPVARQCAMCPRKQHALDDQCPGFQPANYVLLTSDYTPNNVGATVTYATTFPEPVALTARGSRVKVIVGSQIASEGLDLKCVREIHVLDPWYHLNRLEQVIGRGVRYCSHRQLPTEERNCLIHLYSLFFDDYETSDAYSYRLAVQKAKSIGKVQRQLKMGAWDCALNHEGILLTGDIKQHHIDAQGKDLGEIMLADKANSSMCDYQECSFRCRLDISSIREEQLDLSTFTVRDARGYILLRESALRQMFSVQPYWPVTEVRKLYSELPDEVLAQALPTVINNRSFELKYKGRPGFLILRAGYVIFQPREVTDTSIPLALRYNTAASAEGGKLWSSIARPPHKPFEGIDTRVQRPSNAGAGVVTEENEDENEDENANNETASVATGGTAGTAGTKVSQSLQALPESPKQWYDLVMEALDKTKAQPAKITVPDELKAKMKGLDDLGTIAFRFRDLPETATVLLAFGLDHFYSYATKKTVYDTFIKGKLHASLAGFIPVLKKNTFKSADIDGYFLMDIKNNRVDTFCKRTGQMTYSVCPSSLAPFVAAATNDASEAVGAAGAPIVTINSRCGRLFGFMVAKPAAGVLSTKTVENTPGGAGSEGADCVGVSNKEPHLLKIQALRNAVQAAGDAELLAAMYPLSAVVKGAKSAARKSFIEETADMKQQTLCIYLEFICRLMDARHIGGKRWFLNEIEFKRSYDTPGSQWPKGK